MLSPRRISLLFLTLLVPFSAAAEVARHMDCLSIDGPVAAEVLDVVDGDTLKVRARPWPQHSVENFRRLRGIDAPEIHSGCYALRRAGEEARATLRQLAREGASVSLSRISGDKYFGRVLADVRLEDGSDPVVHLLATGQVRRYDGGRRPSPKC